MIRASARADKLVQRLRARAARIAAGRTAKRRPPARSDWHSAATLWPDLLGDPRDGK
ncbi:hypothetical protein FHS52_000785 [Erythromicrobium ramosum]|uniref:Uncharacterized protein n=1 Tax=Erythrobacter ramosus TaxID=35811 RepID=A0A6I4UIT0_9SPHN|nr:hypothetical protein [Erythrobacter ramosus]MBB3774842.1 hypothetical protein [Erythrobacter ramosus]MXP37517.1 hypothetical protein [Erythrobacter ramosus]